MDAVEIEQLLSQARDKIHLAEALLKMQKVSHIYQAQLHIGIAQALALIAIGEDLHRSTWGGLTVHKS